MADLGYLHADALYAAGLAPGPHTLYAMLVDNHHMPFMPMIFVSIIFVAKGEGDEVWHPRTARATFTVSFQRHR